MVINMDAITKAQETLKKNKIRWVHTAFVDIRGLMQDVVLPARHFTEGQALTAGIGFDGSSVRGFKAINESDMILKPAADTLSIIPWTMDNDIQRSAIILGDVYEAFGGNEPSVVDPRGYVAKNAVKAAAAMGYTGFFGPELEYFVFNSIDPTKLVWDMWVSPKGGAQRLMGSTTSGTPICRNNSRSPIFKTQRSILPTSSR